MTNLRGDVASSEGEIRTKKHEVEGLCQGVIEASVLDVTASEYRIPIEFATFSVVGKCKCNRADSKTTPVVGYIERVFRSLVSVQLSWRVIDSPPRLPYGGYTCHIDELSTICDHCASLRGLRTFLLRSLCLTVCGNMGCADTSSHRAGGATAVVEPIDARVVPCKNCHNLSA